MRKYVKVWQGFMRYPKNHKTLTLARMRRLLLRCLFAISHRRIIKNYLRSHQTRKLQIGSGRNALNGWLNTDLTPTKEVVFLDATKRFPFDDCTFDYVFGEHVISSLAYQDGVRMIRECYRVLKPGGKIRISTPDLRFLIELYAENKTELQQRYIVWAVNRFIPDIRIYSDTFVINNFFYNWGHRFIYDYKTLQRVLHECGFVNITRYTPGESDDRNLKGIEMHGYSIGDEFNKLESLVLEGTKPHTLKKK
jgi:predicted SAM-dependent methyltransferase